jgi:hypothetical protein
MSAPAVPPSSLPLRTPTGKPAWPRLLISGEEGAWKSSTAAKFSADPRCGVMWWLEVGDGENTADEYAALPGVSYDIVDHDGSFGSIYGAVCVLWGEAKRRETAGELPAVLSVDSMSSVYGMLVSGADKIARRKLARQIADNPKDKRDPWDPEVEVTITPDLWNRVNARWGMFMAKILTWPGPVLMTAREKLATPFVGGKPQENAPKEWTLEGHKQLGFQCTAWVRMTRDRAPEVVKMRSAREEVRSGTQEPNRRRPDFTPAALIFDWIGCEVGASRAPDHKQLRGDDELPSDRPTPSPGEQAAADQAAAQRRDAVGRTATAILESRTLDDLEVVADKVARWSGRDEVVADPPLAGDDRDRLGVHESQRVTLTELVALCRGYLQRWSAAVRDEIGPGAASDVEPEPAGITTGTPVGQAATEPDAEPASDEDDGEPAADPDPDGDLDYECGVTTTDGQPCPVILTPGERCPYDDDHAPDA